jgi:hypothetical protein
MAAALLVTGITVVGALVSYLQVRPLVHGPLIAVVGTVVDEDAGFLGVRNFVAVDYEVGGRTYSAEIPVKGNGFRGPRLDPYYYRAGVSVDLLAVASDPTVVRTKDRWVPAFYNWAAVAATAGSFALLVAILQRRRGAKNAEHPGG